MIPRQERATRWISSAAIMPSVACPTSDIAAKRTATGGPIVAASAINAEGQAPGFAAQFCDVEVDPETGKVTIINFILSHDCGRMINPMIVAGQMQGGVAHGISNTLRGQGTR